ncbi:MAG: hypothetical protein MRY83_01600 [Flavobacteriales bacterium]|nr:hypothetical protein [Flavobacteriales bacterium]
MKKFYLFLILPSLIFLISRCTKEKVEIESDPEPVPVSYCDSLKNLGEVSFQCEIDTIIQTHCGTNDNGCHGANAANPTLNTFNGIKAIADNGRLVARAVDNNPSAMPPAGPLPDSLKQKIQAWVDAGAKDN